MIEYRTQPIDKALLRLELQATCDFLIQWEIKEAVVSFGWASNLHIDDLWKGQTVAVGEIVAFIATSERSGVMEMGESDTFVEVPGCRFTLCHEGDVHVEGRPDLVELFHQRWQALGYSPYCVPQRA